ncbi:MAG TPA: TetR/AcrR family transcriptional regulator [Pseudonocardiaceae bacterium]|nr:TetR/AcrR family transcriptional regulator [Pseudonocardiaceae bacterium]
MGHRERLLAAARTLLEEKGYARITARDLVAASDTNLASIGYHFGSKEELLNEAIEAASEEWTDRLAEVAMADPAAAPVERGVAAWATMLKLLPANRTLALSFVEALAQAERSPRLGEQLTQHYRAIRGRVAGLVAESIGAGATPEDPRCEAIASLVIAVCDGLAVQCLIDPDRMTAPEDFAAAVLMLFGGQSGQPG